MRSLAILALLPLAACSLADGHGRGPRTTRSYPLADFTGVALNGSDDVDVRVGSGFSVRAAGLEKALDRLRIVRAGDTLKVGRIPSVGFNWGGEDDHVTVFVTMPRIVSAAVAGSGDLRIDRAEGERFDGDSTGSGGIAVAALRARAAHLAVSGSGDIDAKGNVGLLAVDIAGSGGVDAPALTAASATVSVAGSGNVRAEVAGPARVSIVGSGDVDLGKRAHCTVSKMGSGEVTCGR